MNNPIANNTHRREETQAVVPKYDAFGRKYDVKMLTNYRTVVCELEAALKRIKQVHD
jgi:hypothetical protein